MIGALLILGVCGHVQKTESYQDNVLNFCGPIAQIICQITLVLFMFGSDVTYLIVIGDQLTKGTTLLKSHIIGRYCVEI